MQGMGAKLLDAARKIVADVLSFTKGFVDDVVVPIMLVALVLGLFFCVASYANAKKRQNGEDIEEKTKYLLIDLVLLVIVGSYGVFWGNILSGFGG